MVRLKPTFEAWHAKQHCTYCDEWMEVIGADGCQVYCPQCWVPTPIPAEFRYWSQRLALAKQKR